MEQEKIYYGIIIFLCAASMLLSPFFYIQREYRGQSKISKSKKWKIIFIANIIIMFIISMIVWWIFIRNNLNT